MKPFTKILILLGSYGIAQDIYFPGPRFLDFIQMIGAISCLVIALVRSMHESQNRTEK